MSKKAMSLLIERLKIEKSVLVYNFNISQFFEATESAGLNVSGGALKFDGNGVPYARYFYIS